MSERDRLENLKDALVEDILSMSDEEVWQEFVEDCGSVEAAQAKMRKINRSFADALEKAKRRASRYGPYSNERLDWNL